MKLLILSGTPKNDGVCHSFVETAMATAKKCGVDAEIVNLSKVGLEKCHMCNDGWGICYKQHKCIFGDKDGFNALQEKMAAADAYVYLTPVYWGEVSEEMKIFLDKFRRCQATKQWDEESEKSFLVGKPSILVASAGGGGGGIVNTFHQMERALQHMGGFEWPLEREGVFDYIAVNRWNQEYKRKALEAAIVEMVSYFQDKEKEAPRHPER